MKEIETPESLRDFSGEILHEIAPEVVREFGSTGPLRFKYGREAITHVDAAVEEKLLQRIFDRYPEHGIQAEEHGAQGMVDSPWQWHIDPIDGTLNYSLGIPIFSMSVAVTHAGEIRAGAVMDPLRNECFTAALGGGALLNGQPIEISDREPLAEAILSLQSSRRSIFMTEPELLQRISTVPLKMRRLGTIALELAYVAAGRFDLLVAGKNEAHNLYDVAAGLLLVEEAGGIVSDGKGEPFSETSTELIVGNPHIHAEAVELIAPYLA